MVGKETVRPLTKNMEPNNPVIEATVISKYVNRQADIVSINERAAQFFIFTDGIMDGMITLEKAEIEKLVAWGQAWLQETERTGRED